MAISIKKKTTKPNPQYVLCTLLSVISEQGDLKKAFGQAFCSIRNI